MRRLLCCLLLAGVNLTAQSVRRTPAIPGTPDRLTPILLALRDPGASNETLRDRLAEEMMTLATVRHQPSESSVTAFAEEFTAALLGKDLAGDTATRLRRCLVDALRPSGSTFLAAARLRETLTELRVKPLAVQSITKRFIAIGEQVRGPDDLPIQPFR